MVHIAHVINPFKASPDSDLYAAQPLTFESMRNAKEQVSKEIKVDLFATMFEEDEEFCPEGFLKTKTLSQSSLDFIPNSTALKLPLIKEILDGLYQATNADYLVYTNVDIGLYPNFYDRITELIEQGLDGFIINRRRLPNHLLDKDLESIYKEKGKPHPGFDCFVFHRSLYPRFQLGDVLIGVPFIGISLSQNLMAYSQNFQLLEEEFITFHVGEEIFMKRAPKSYFLHNKKQFWNLIDGPLKADLAIQKFPYQSDGFLKRWWKYLVQPSIPIKLCIQLELKRLKA